MTSLSLPRANVILPGGALHEKVSVQTRRDQLTIRKASGEIILEAGAVAVRVPGQTSVDGSPIGAWRYEIDLADGGTIKVERSAGGCGCR